jgi:hypothetical protein
MYGYFMLFDWEEGAPELDVWERDIKILVYPLGPSGLVLRCAWWIGETEGGTNVGWSGREG